MSIEDFLEFSAEEVAARTEVELENYVMKLQIEVEGDTIVDAKFKTFGCGSAIASSSLATEWIKGKKVDEALEITNTEIVEELSLPPVKIHCSVLAEDAIKGAMRNYQYEHETTGRTKASA